MRLIDPTKKRQTVTETEIGRNIRHTEHHDGTVDAEVKIKAVKITFGAPPSKPLVAAIAELESAIREWRVAKHSTSDEWKTYAKARMKSANERVQETQ